MAVPGVAVGGAQCSDDRSGRPVLEDARARQRDVRRRMVDDHERRLAARAERRIGDIPQHPVLRAVRTEISRCVGRQHQARPRGPRAVAWRGQAHGPVRLNAHRDRCSDGKRDDGLLLGDAVAGSDDRAQEAVALQSAPVAQVLRRGWRGLRRRRRNDPNQYRDQYRGHARPILPYRHLTDLP